MMARELCRFNAQPFETPTMPEHLAPFLIAIIPSVKAYITPEGTIRKYEDSFRLADMSAAVPDARGTYRPYVPVNFRRGVF